jgi:hypothetical protein
VLVGIAGVWGDSDAFNDGRMTGPVHGGVRISSAYLVVALVKDQM